MNQEQLLDEIAQKIRTAAKDGDGIIVLVFDEDFTALTSTLQLSDSAKFLALFRSSDVRMGLPPSVWLDLGKKLWNCYCSKPKSDGSIKFPAAGKAGRPKNKPPDLEPPKVS